MNYAYNKPDLKLVGLTIAVVAILVIGIAAFAPGITGMFGKVEQPNGEVIINEQATLNDEPSCKFVDETYTEMEPYTVTECISVPTVNSSCETRQLKFSLTKECEYSYYSNNVTKLNSKCVVRNLDDREGTFTVNIGIINKNGETIKEQRTVDVLPQSSAEIVFSYVTDMGSCYCAEAVVPVKEVCFDKIENNTQCFDLNKYREVEKVRTVQTCD